jgi:tRNA(Arg) A34 adenosine deaminase TadA
VPELAFLKDGDRTYYSISSSPIVHLIQAVYDFKPEQARRILRSRIYSTASPTAMCLGMVKVAAKRLSAPVLVAPEPSWIEIRPKEAPPLLRENDFSDEARTLIKQRNFMAAARDLAQKIPRQRELYDSDRRIAALLVSAQGEFLGASLNSNAKNRTRHAEVNLVQAFVKEYGTRLPKGSRIYVTLKCCKMCAAMIWCQSEDIKTNRIFFGENDPGPNARSTIFTPHSFERKRATSSGEDRLLAPDLALVLEFHESPSHTGPGFEYEYRDV